MKTRRVTLFTGSALTILVGCGTPAFDRDPQLSPVGVDPSELAAARNVSVPMPPPEAVRVPYRARAPRSGSRARRAFSAISAPRKWATS